jgi:putative Holliday junction resolvase
MSERSSPRGGKAMGVDLGTRRIGVSVSDSAGTLAFPVTVLERSGDPDLDRARLVAMAQELGAARVVVGLPLGLDGRHGAAARTAAQEAAALEAPLQESGVAVETFDERLTTVSAQSALAQAGKRGQAARKVVDSAAATVLLQAWLDAR